MDGFTTVPVEKDASKSFSSTPSNFQTIGSSNFDSGVEIVDEEKVKADLLKAKNRGWILYLAIFTMLGVFSYFGYLVFSRMLMLEQISNYSEQLRGISQNIDTKEMQDFQSMDVTLQTINERLSKHVLNSEILTLVNQNLRNTLQVTEYRLSVRDKEVEVNLTSVSPSFKELAEQTEKFFALKEAGSVKAFSISNLSFEAETRRLKFNMRIIFDKNKVTASAVNTTVNSPENI